MAQRKTDTKKAEAENPEVETPASEASEVTEQPTDETQEPVDAEAPSGAVEGDEIPAHVKKILKLYPSYAELWVTAAGGAFPVKPRQNNGAILYKNPFYKS